MPARNFTSEKYRYGFNSQEKDDEVTGVSGSIYSAEFWQYDARLGRRWNRDQIVKHWESPYAPFANNPIWFSDLLGLDTIPSSKFGVEKPFNFEKDVLQLPEVVITPEITIPKTPNPETDENVFTTVADATHFAHLFIETAEIGMGLAVEEGFWLGKTTAGAYRLYGKNFYGNQSIVKDGLRLLKLDKAVKVGGVAVTAIGLGADALNYFNSLPGDAREAAAVRLVHDILLSGLYYVSLEAGILVSIGGVVYDDPKTQQYIRQNLEQIANDINNPRNYAAWKKLQEMDMDHDPCPCFFKSK